MIKVSVILPVYGVAEFIEDCTRSLLAQTLNEMEFLFVDDHGPDNSIELARNVIEGHPRAGQFHFLRPEHNLGAGQARNFGLQQAQGEYIAFVDSDDTIDARMFETMYKAAKENNVDICCCQQQKYYMDGSVGDIMENPRVKGKNLSHEEREYILTHYVSLFAPMIYRRAYIEENKIAFPIDRAADDSYFISCVWMTAKSVYYVDQPFYHYLIRPGSVCTTKNSSKFQLRINNFNRLLQYSKDHHIYDEYKDAIDFMYVKKGYLSSVINYVTNSLEPETATIKAICKQCDEQIPDYHKSKFYKSNLSLRVLDGIVRHCPKIATIVLRQYAKQNNIIG